ncbi:MAG TPA: BamA/TamA family outer membrane protein [Polyangiaceae bacterium]|nr:BamA/TamA family outer membrane protein [Polyangiaceae bacterium]
MNLRTGPGRFRPRPTRPGVWVLGALLGVSTAFAQPAPAPPAAVPAPAAPAPTPAEPPPAPAEPAPEAAPPPEPTPDAASRSRPDEPEHAENDSSLKYTLDDIEVRGNDKTRSRVVLRYVPFRPGDVIDVDDPQVELTRYRLLGTGFFREVELSLRKGSRRGHVVLIIEVVERNTLVVNDLWMGLSADADTRGQPKPLTPYAGVDVAETNLAGTGISLGAAIGVARDQTALRIRFFDPAFLGGKWMTDGTLLFNDANDFFGNADVLFDDPGQTELQRFAVVRYERFGGSLGIGRDLSVSTQLWAHYRLERIDAEMPLAASHLRGTRPELDREPIDFSILRGESVLSTLSATLQHDTRDKPILPTSGWFTSVTTEVSLSPFGSDYPYSRIDVLANKWWTLPWHEHVVRLRLFGGAISGRAPFFERYYVGDFSDFRASRVLGLNVERRPVPNFFGTDIVEVRYGDYAAKIEGEYRIPLYRGSRSVFGIDLFARAGLFAVAGQRDVTHPPGGYSGAALVPIDFSANLGVQMDTSAGGFTFALANVFGFLPALSEGK